MSRYIDADKLKAHYAWWGREDEEKKLFDSVVDVQPTADVVEVRHGHWIAVRQRMFACGDPVGEMVIHHYQCSECGRQEDNREEYCHCGAKMDEKDGEEK